MEEEIKELLIDARTGFDWFYSKCSDLSFWARLPLELVWTQYASRVPRSRAVIITSVISDALRLRLDESSRLGNETVLIDAGELSL